MYVLEWRSLHISRQLYLSIIYALPVANGTKLETATTPPLIPLSNVGVLALDHHQDVDIEYLVDCLNQRLCCFTKCLLLIAVSFFVAVLCHLLFNYA